MRVEQKSIIVTSNQSDFNVNFYPPIALDQDGHNEIGLIGLDMYNSIPNIDHRNARFKFSYMEKLYFITIPTGSYEIESLNEYLTNKVAEVISTKANASRYGEYFSIISNLNTLKCTIKISNPYLKIYFDHEDSIAPMLGFGKEVLAGLQFGTISFESSDLVNIISVNSIMVHCSIVEGSYLNHNPKPIIYSFYPNVPPGYKIVEKPNVVVHLPIRVPNFDNIRFWLTDQNGNPLNLRGETVTMRFQLRSHLQN